MRTWILFLFWLTVPGWGSAQIFSLSPPQVTIDSVFFCRKATLTMAMDHPGVIIRYTRDGQAVTASSSLYEMPLQLAESGMIRARCFHPDFRPSPEVEIQLHRLDRRSTVSVRSLIPAPHDSYPGTGARGLTDQKKGLLAFRSSPDQWTGWELDSVQMEVVLDEPAPGKTLHWSALEDAGAWILGPGKITLHQNGQRIGVWKREQAPDLTSNRFVFPEIVLPDSLTDDPLTVTLYATPLPAGHPGAGRPAWMFLDELFLTTQ